MRQISATRQFAAVDPFDPPARMEYSGGMSRAFFVSDLHLFARRSEAPRYLEAIRRRAALATTFVLGGDIFDFRWSTQATSGEAVEAAVAWLKQLTGECPGCHFHYLLGNHDYNDDFIRRLAEFAPGVQNLSWHKFYLRLGDSVFLHGDAADRRRTTPQVLALDRDRWLHDRRRGRMHRRMYDLAIRAGLHRPLPYLVHPSAGWPGGSWPIWSTSARGRKAACGTSISATFTGG